MSFLILMTFLYIEDLDNDIVIEDLVLITLLYVLMTFLWKIMKFLLIPYSWVLIHEYTADSLLCLC